MAKYIDKDVIVTEIERYKHKADERLKIKNRALLEDMKDLALQNLCGNLLNFINTLEVKEVDLEKETAYRYGFESGAKWQEEQFEKNRLAACDDLTAEQAQIESEFVVQHLKNFNRTPTFIDAIEYGRKQMIEKACEWLKYYISYDDFGGNMEWLVPFENDECMIQHFKTYMEE